MTSRSPTASQLATLLEAAPGIPAQKEPEALWHLRKGIKAGRPWHMVILEAIGMWTLPEEEWRGRVYRYVIQDEAFDWLLLAERLCAELGALIPLKEREKLLFWGHLPVETSPGEFKELVGFNKYRGILNFWYGVVIEEALQSAVEKEVRKGQRASGRPDDEDLVEVAYQRLYNDTCTSLLRQFRREMGYALRSPLSLTQTKEFTYWLFKVRLRYWDPARVASDTRKGLKQLHQIRGSSNPI